MLTKLSVNGSMTECFPLFQRYIFISTENGIIEGLL